MRANDIIYSHKRIVYSSHMPCVCFCFWFLCHLSM